MKLLLDFKMESVISVYHVFVTESKSSEPHLLLQWRDGAWEYIY